MVARTLCIVCWIACLIGCSTGESPQGGAAQPDKTPPSPAPAIMDPRLVGREWRLQAFGAVGREEPPVGDATIALVLNDDGTLDGSAGCNTYRTTYRAGAAGDLVVRALVRTNKSCGKLLDRQETVYLDVLHRVESYEVHDDRLLLFYESGSRNLIYSDATSSSSAPGESPQTPSSSPARREPEP